MEDITHLPILDYPPGIQYDDPLAGLGDNTQVVGDE
jgi:hypothetical protein